MRRVVGWQSTDNRCSRCENLKTWFYTPDGIVKAVNGVSFTLHEGEALGLVGESGCGKSVSAMSLMRLIPTPPGRIVEGEVIFDGRDLLKLQRRGDPAGPRQRHRDDLPGPDDLAQPGPDDRAADRRGARAAQGHEPGPGSQAYHRAAGAGRHPVRPEPRRRLPPPVLGRHAPARDDRHGALLRPEAADRRRADDGPRRDDPGPDPGPDRPASEGSWHGRHHDHPRPRRGRRRRRQDQRHVRRLHRRVGTGRGAVREAAPPVHARACSARSRASTSRARRS